MPPIQPLASSGPTATTPCGRADRASGFSVPLGTPAATTAPESASPIQAASGLAALLATQELADPRLRDRAARRHATATLDALAALQAALLGEPDDGGMGGDALGRLAALAGQPVPADPGLAALTRAIALRAAVELARRAPPAGGS
jgi:hypothetical protein